MADRPRQEPVRSWVAEPTVQVLLERVRHLYDSSPLMYLIVDAEGTILEANQRALRRLGKEAVDLIGLPLEGLLDEDSRAALGGLLSAVDDGELPAGQPVELKLLSPAGELVTSATVAVTRGSDGTPVEIHLMMLDISDARRLEQRMLQADRLACVGQLAAGVAHEINNPASWVIGNLRYLEERLPLLMDLLRGDVPEGTDGRAAGALLVELPRLCQESLHGMERIRHIVRDLQLFAREQGESRERIDVNTLCDTVANMAWPEIRRRARLEKCYGDIPPVWGNAGRLSQVLLNLLINAAQAIPEGAQSRNKIVITTAAVDGGVTISVRDTGCGIPSTVLPRIFDPFFTTKPPGKGTGLGLSVSHEIVRAHGGRLDVQSEVGVGSTFTVWLPLGAEEQGAEPTRPAQVEPAPQPTHGKVLVIDDEPELLRALARTLRSTHDVILASSGAEGMEQLRTHRDIDVVLCDVMMPETSGMDLYESVPHALRDRFIFMSGDTASGAVQAFLGSLRAPHLPKPVEPEELLRAVDQAVRRRRGARAPS
ncbi:MAG: ATP-binding protein [Myxococcales bacterium]|nr:ATP-binding protein [Myxococcota bacterium]MDW8280783.1 ATP-binding protein [Myxococcales bacterium]